MLVSTTHSLEFKAIGTNANEQHTCGIKCDGDVRHATRMHVDIQCNCGMRDKRRVIGHEACNDEGGSGSGGMHMGVHAPRFTGRASASGKRASQPAAIYSRACVGPSTSNSIAQTGS